MYILAISGSLRAGSSNTALLEAASLVAPPGVRIVMYEGLGQLPHFNPDLDTPDLDTALLPREVAELRAEVGRADALLLSTPEYAHGIPGVMKNGLDWLVGSVEFPGKPVAVLCASPGSGHAEAQLAEVLTTMSARLVSDASIGIPLRGKKLDARAITDDPTLAETLRTAVVTLVTAAATNS